MKGHVILWARAHEISYPPEKFGGHRHCGSEDNDFSLPCDLARARDQRFMSPYRQDSIKISYHFAKFGGHSQCGREVIIVLMRHVIF